MYSEMIVIKRIKDKNLIACLLEEFKKKKIKIKYNCRFF